MGSERRSIWRGARRLARVVLWGMAIGQVVDAAWLRGRQRRIAALPAAGVGPSAAAAPDVDVVSASGVDVDAATLAAVGQEMAASGAEVVDLLPPDLPVERAMLLLHRLEPGRLSDDPFYTPGGGHEAVALRRSASDRMGDGSGPVDRGQLVRRTVKAQRYAPRAATVRVAPGLRAAPRSPEERWRELEELTATTWPYGAFAPVLVAGEAAYLLAITGGLLVAPVAGAAALATWSAQPLLVFGSRSPERSGSLRPPALLRSSLLRLPRAWAENLGTALAGYRETRASAARRAAEPAPAVPPPEELFERPRETCPWCGSRALAGRLDTTDLLQHKPGRFHLDECGDCSHIFQNPALSPAGMDYYYDQFYDGAGEEPTEAMFAAMGPSYRKRLDIVARFVEPRAWLDVGTGHGHFCLAGRQRWPAATFDGLDLSESVDEARRRGWVDTAYRGLFPDLADGLPRSYDVVSMHHYLEHTREPRGELAAAAKVLEPGGYLMIEVPDPASPWARRLGRWWHCWFQPQHQHFIPCGNLARALEETGFDVVSVERGPATMGVDLSGAVAAMIEDVARSPHLPWLPPPAAGHRAKRLAAVAAGLPLLTAALAADVVKDARLGADGVGNAYRIVARRA